MEEEEEEELALQAALNGPSPHVRSSGRDAVGLRRRRRPMITGLVAVRRAWNARFSKATSCCR